MKVSENIKYYSREDISRAIFSAAKDREIQVWFFDRVGSRPEVLEYPREVADFARKGASSFHCSEERWEDARRLSPNLTPAELNSMRVGWDLVLDIDFPDFNISKQIAFEICKVLEGHGVSPGVKFSGNKGFHIIVCWEVMPHGIINGVDMKDGFSSVGAAVLNYIKFLITKPLLSKFLKGRDVKEVCESYNINRGDVIKIMEGKSEEAILNVAEKLFSNIDFALTSSRHMFRMPYSLHEKSGLVSLPIEANKILSFEKSMAKPEVVKVDVEFFKKEGDALNLFREALDFFREKSFSEGIKGSKDYGARSFAVVKLNERLYPPCIKNILRGVSDGKKRALFILMNFFRSFDWEWDEIEKLVLEWNKKNNPPLKQGYINSQFKWFRQNPKSILPPNCDASNFYDDTGYCTPDEICQNKKIKNPVNYVRRVARIKGGK